MKFTPGKQQALEQHAHQHLNEVLALIARPTGYAKLTPPQRQFLLAAVLGSMVPADAKIRDVELNRIETLLETKFRLTAERMKEVLVLAHEGLNAVDVANAAKAMSELFNIEDRVNLIGLLLDVALCDMELARQEEDLVNKVAELAQVPRKRVAEQHARVARQGHA